MKRITYLKNIKDINVISEISDIPYLLDFKLLNYTHSVIINYGEKEYRYFQFDTENKEIINNDIYYNFNIINYF